MRRLPFFAGQPRQRSHLRRGGGGHRDRLRRLPRHGQQIPDVVHQRARGAARRARHVALTHAGRPQALRLARRQALSARRARPGQGMGNVAGQGQRQSAASQIQREGGARQTPVRRRLDAVGSGGRFHQACARQRQGRVSDLPPVLDDELRRLPSADPGEREDRSPSLRRRRESQFRYLQPAGCTRRHVPVGPPRHGEGQQDRSGAVEFGAGAVVHQHQPRAHLHSATADRGERVFFAGVRTALSAHRTQDGDQDLQRLPRIGGKRQQRDHGAAPAAGYQLRQFRRLQRMGRRGEAGERDSGDRMGRAAGRHRQLSAALCLSGLVCGPPEA